MLKKVKGVLVGVTAVAGTFWASNAMAAAATLSSIATTAAAEITMGPLLIVMGAILLVIAGIFIYKKIYKTGSR